MAGTWKALTNQPKFNASTMLLLTDGSVMCQDAGGRSWWRLTPDAVGSYVNGSWDALAPMNQTRLYYSSAVLKDGRVFVAGGEYSDAGSETNTCEIYDPKLDTWTVIAPPAGWGSIGDAPCSVLPDGRVLVGDITGTRTTIFDPVSGTWTAAAQKLDSSSEESWVLMPDNTIITAQCSGHPKSEKYLVADNKWIATGNTPDDLVEHTSIEIGAGVLLPDGHALFIGATPHTALYMSGENPQDAGTWSAGPAIPADAQGRICGAKDAPACLMVNGNVLLTVGPVDGVSGDYLGPTYFHEFTGNSLVKVADAPNAGSVPFVGRMLLLPTGEILYASGTRSLYAYIYTSVFQEAWRPKISTFPARLTAGLSYTLSGTQLNGLSQAVGYGDDAAAATNYPLVRLRTVDGKTFYCRTFEHSTMGVATNQAMHTTNFEIPIAVPEGSYELAVVANGIPSTGVTVSIMGHQIPVQWNSIWASLRDTLTNGPHWAIGPHGPVPVDLLAPDLRANVRDARRAILSGVRTLQKIGRKGASRRVSIGKSAPPAIDPDIPQTAGNSPKRIVNRNSARVQKPLPRKERIRIKRT